MNAVDVVPRGTPRLEHATFGPASVTARSGCPNAGIAHDDRLDVGPAHRSIRAYGRVDGSGDDPDNTYLLAAVLLVGQDMARTAPLLHRLGTLTAGRTDGPIWQRRVAFLWAVHAERVADHEGVLDHWRAAEQSRGPCCASCADPGPEPNHEGQLHAVDALICEQFPLLAIRAHAGLGQTQVAQTLLESHFGGQDRAEASRPATVAVIASQEGRLRDAHRLATAALQTAASPAGPSDLTELDARHVLAEVCFERNELDAAQAQLETALRGWSIGGLPSLWPVEADLIRVLIARQRPGEALSRLESLRRTLGAALTRSPLRRKLDQAEIDARVALGDLDGAFEFARSLAAQDLSCEAAARLELYAGRPDRALSRLESVTPATLAAEIRNLVLRACVNRQQGRQQRAEHTMQRAIQLARPDQYIRPFLEVATLTLPLLRGLCHSEPEPYLRRVVNQAEKLVDSADLPGSAGMLEPLTERERQVLRHLSSHHNLPQIGAAMFLSTNTIKTHVKAIYRKMGAASRDEAVTIARGHGLLCAGLEP